MQMAVDLHQNGNRHNRQHDELESPQRIPARPAAHDFK